MCAPVEFVGIAVCLDETILERKVNGCLTCEGRSIAPVLLKLIVVAAGIDGGFLLTYKISEDQIQQAILVINKALSFSMVGSCRLNVDPGARIAAGRFESLGPPLGTGHRRGSEFVL